MRPGVIKDPDVGGQFNLRDRLKDSAPMFPTTARKYYRESPVNSDKELGETLAREYWPVMGSHFERVWYIMAPQEMESLFLEQWWHYVWYFWHTKFEKGESAAIINLFTYLYILWLFFISSSSGMKPEFAYRCFNEIRWFLSAKLGNRENTLILLFEGSSEFNSMAINYSLVPEMFLNRRQGKFYRVKF